MALCFPPPNMGPLFTGRSTRGVRYIGLDHEAPPYGPGLRVLQHRRGHFALNSLTPEERQHLYKLLRLRPCNTRTEGESRNKRGFWPGVGTKKTTCSGICSADGLASPPFQARLDTCTLDRLFDVFTIGTWLVAGRT